MTSVYSAAGGGRYGAVAVSGEVNFGLSYDLRQGVLNVLIREAKNLAAVDEKRNRSDPYVKVGPAGHECFMTTREFISQTLSRRNQGVVHWLTQNDRQLQHSNDVPQVYLLPDRSKSGKRKTKVRKHTVNPVFNEVINCPTRQSLWLEIGVERLIGGFNVPPGKYDQLYECSQVLRFQVDRSELTSRTLWLSLWHCDMFGRNDFLGEVMKDLSSDMLETNTSHWYPLQERVSP